MNNKDQSQNDAVDNDIFTATPKTTETNKSETKSDSISSVKRYVPPHLRNRAINARENSNPNTNLEQPAAKGRERGPRPESQTQENPDERKNTESHFIHQPTHSAEGGVNYELKPRDIRLEQELFPRYERNDSLQFSTTSYSTPTSTIQVFGDDVPAPIQSLADIDLGPVITNNIALASLVDTLTPIQKHGMPIILSGRDLFTRAQTGSGKTYTYLFPIIAKLTRVNPNPAVIATKATPQCLIVTPAREFGYNIYYQARKFVYRSHLKACVVYGGAPVANQAKELKHGCDILVATPGRLMDLIERGILSLANVKFLCLEEVDRMLDMGFEPQLRCLVEKHDMPRVGVRQTLLFSSTFPKEVQRLAQELMYDYILLSGNPTYHYGSNLCNQQICFVDENDKYNALIDALVASEGLAMVYVSTKKRAEEVNNKLLNDGFPSTCIHGDRTQQQREEALTQFRQGIKLVLVATDVAARGLDISLAAHMINYDMPNDIDSYVYRIGRTGHVARKGVSISFFSEENKSMAKDLVELLEQSDQEVPDWLREYAAENHQNYSDRRRGVNVPAGRGGRGRGGSRGFGARARGRGYADNRFEPYGRGQNNTNNDRNGNGNDYSLNASNNNGNNDGGSQSSSGGSNTNWW